MSTHIPSVEARANIQAAMARQATVVTGHHRITAPIKNAAQTARERFRTLLVRLKKKQAVCGNDLPTKALSAESMVEEEQNMSSFEVAEDSAGGELSSTPDSPKVSKSAPRLLAADCSFLDDCDEETPEEREAIARKVEAAIAFAKHPASRIARSDLAIHYHNNEYIRYGRIDSQPRIVRQASIRSQTARVVNWVEDVVDESIDADFELAELESPEPHITTPEAWWTSSPEPSPHRTLAVKDSLPAIKVLTLLASTTVPSSSQLQSGRPRKTCLLLSGTTDSFRQPC